MERLPDLGSFATIPEYIYGITREIWEERGVGGKLRAYYADDCLVRAPTGLTDSMAGVAADTLQTLHQFPNRQLIGEDVIWQDCGDGSFLSSHRLISVMHHTGNGRFGPASRRLVKSRIIADCWVKDGKVTEEWLVRDQVAFARCLGIEPRTFAETLLTQDRATGRVPFFLPEHDQPGAYVACVADDPAAKLCVDLLQALWDEKDLAAIPRFYFAGAALAVPGGGWCNGLTEIDAFVVSYLAAIPDARLTVQSAMVNRAPERTPRVSLRWSVWGTHTGWGRFGPPTGAPLFIMGLSHFAVADGQVQQEWLLIDEVSLWKQLLVAATDLPHAADVANMRGLQR